MWEVLTQKDPWDELPEENLWQVLLQTVRAGHRPEVRSPLSCRIRALNAVICLYVL